MKMFGVRFMKYFVWVERMLMEVMDGRLASQVFANLHNNSISRKHSRLLALKAEVISSL